IAEPLSESELTRPAYPRDWSIADVLSHLGSFAVIMQRRLDDALAGRETPDDAAPAVWDTWNAKTPVAKRDDALSADAALLARPCAVTADEPVQLRHGPHDLRLRRIPRLLNTFSNSA